MLYTWAYKKLPIDTNEDGDGWNERELKKMNALGQQGWELVSSLVSGSMRVHYFKRQGKPLGDLDNLNR